MKSDFNNAQKEKLESLGFILKPVDEFVLAHPKMSYIEFDYYSVHDLTLFAVEPDFDFEKLRKETTDLLKVLPIIKRIFSKPIIHLKDTRDVLPVESVRIINQDTMLHIGTHSQNVSNITEDGIKPLKLLTRIYEDNYGIYENQIFCNFVDYVLRFCKKNIRYIKDIIYANENLEFNLLERLNHLNYYLALGKLHTGYIRDFDKYYATCKSLLVDLDTIINTIKPRQKTPIYQKNKYRNHDLTLKKTNIFLMQKDYHKIYVAYKELKSEQRVVNIKNINVEEIEHSYFNFVQILMIFAITHFNFKPTTKDKINLKKLNSTFSYKNYKLSIEAIEDKALSLIISKDKTYKIVFVTSTMDNYKEFISANEFKTNTDEYILCSPFEENYTETKTTFISIENIDSFRRLEQAILKGMINADETHSECPFCEGDLVYNEEENGYCCDNCRTVIKKGSCDTLNQEFYYTKISHYEANQISASKFKKDDQWLYNRHVESLMFFRNITKINQNGEIICPYCNKVHKFNN